MLTLRSDLAWVALNADWQAEYVLKCKEHGTLITTEVRRRSIYSYPMPGGSGSVFEVLHLYCRDCHPERHGKNDDEGEPIFDIELVDADKNLRVCGDALEIVTQKMKAFRL